MPARKRQWKIGTVTLDTDEAIDYEYYRSERFIDEAGGFPVSDGFVQPYGELPYSDTAVGVGVYQAILARAKDAAATLPVIRQE